MKRQITEVLWVVGGQAATAIGTLIGVRVLTQFLAPAAYGTVSLSLGMSVLAISVVSTPLTQAAIHFYPNVVATGSVHDLLASLLRCFRIMAPRLAAVALLGGASYVYFGHGSPIVVVLLVLLLASDCWRSANLSLLNAARRQGRYALWTATDAWSRPLAGVVAVQISGQSAIGVLAAYVIVSMCLLCTFSYGLWPGSGHSAAPSPERSRQLDSRLWSYALPLVPLGVISWASSLGDRYIIGSFLSVADAGVYAAIYGLSSAPFMIVNGTAEQALRPIYQAAVSAGNQARAQRIFLLWLGVVFAICATGLAILIVSHEYLAGLFVGKPYRYAADLMPWIGAGYAIRAISYVFERVCYAYGRTRRTLTTQIYAACATAIATPLGVLTLGLKGAAMAVPAYFSVQLVVAIVLARRTIAEASRSAGDIVDSIPARA